jgi:hypothetical protein
LKFSRLLMGRHSTCSRRKNGIRLRSPSDCVQCHERSRFDPKHEGVSGYPAAAAPLNFCVECHTRGRVRPIAGLRANAQP